jgi:hypothetical protein
VNKIVTKVAIAGLSLLASAILASPALAASAVDQQSNWNSDPGGSCLKSTQSLGQLFTAGVSGSLTAVRLNVIAYNPPPLPTNLSVQIFGVSDGLPTGSPLSTTTITDVTDIPSTPGSEFTVQLDAVPLVKSGVTYALVLSTSDASDSCNPLAWQYGIYSTVSHGALSNSTGAPGWNQTGLGPTNFAFATFVDTADGQAPTPIRQGLPLPASGSCADVQDTQYAWGTGLTGGWQKTWEPWVTAPMGATHTGGWACSRTLVNAGGQGWAIAPM